MATELRTKIAGSISLIELKMVTKQILENYSIEYANYEVIADSQDVVISTNTDKTILVYESNHPDEIVELTTIYQEPILGYEDPDEDGWCASATIRASKDSSLKFNLAAALIIYLASLDSSDIIDESCYWVSKRKQTLAEFKKEFIPK